MESCSSLLAINHTMAKWKRILLAAREPQTAWKKKGSLYSAKMEFGSKQLSGSELCWEDAKEQRQPSYVLLVHVDVLFYKCWKD